MLLLLSLFLQLLLQLKRLHELRRIFFAFWWRNSYWSGLGNSLKEHNDPHFVSYQCVPSSPPVWRLCKSMRGRERVEVSKAFTVTSVQWGYSSIFHPILSWVSLLTVLTLSTFSFLQNTILTSWPQQTIFFVSLLCLQAKLLLHVAFGQWACQIIRTSPAVLAKSVLSILVMCSNVPSKLCILRITCLWHGKTMRSNWPSERNLNLGIYNSRIRTRRLSWLKGTGLKYKIRKCLISKQWLDSQAFWVKKAKRTKMQILLEVCE